MSLEISVPIAEKETVGKLNQLIKELDNGREKLKAQAFVNIMFLYGNHHFKLTRRRGFDNLDDIISYEVDRYFNRQKIKRTSNYILPLYRAIMARLLRMKAHIHADPTTSTSNDRDVARIAKMVGEDFWQNCNRNNHWLANEYSGMQSVLGKLCNFELVLGVAYLEPYFNPKAQTLLYDKATKSIFQAEVGETEIRTHHMLNVFKDRYNRYTITRRRVSPQQVWDEFGKDVAPDLSVEFDNTIDAEIERALYGDVYGDRAKQEGVWLYTKYEMPCKEYPKGYMYACTETDQLLEGDLPAEYKLRQPLIEFRYQDLGFSGRGQGAIEQVVDLQQDLNFTLTRISQTKKLMTGKLLAPKGSKLNTQWDSEVGQIISYQQGLAPQYVPAPEIPQYYMKELERIRRDMEDIMNAHDASMGQDPKQVRSGVGMQTLAEIDNSMLAPELMSLEQKLGYTMEMVLDICEWKYDERRLLTTCGDDMQSEVNSFIGSDLVGQKRIRVRMGSGLPDDLQSRQQYIDTLVKGGYLTVERAKDLLEMGDIDGVWRNLDEAGAKTDIMNIVEGNMQVQAEPWEDAAVRLKIINDYRKGSRYQSLPPQKKQGIDQLANQYQTMLGQQQQAAMEMQAKQAALIAQGQEGAKASGKSQVEATKSTMPKRPVIESINYKDLPPSAKVQMLTQAGIQVNPSELIMDHVIDKAGPPVIHNKPVKQKEPTQ